MRRWISRDRRVTLYLSDCRNFIGRETMRKRVDAVITDPPWGVKSDTDYTRFVGCQHKTHNFPPVAGDEEGFEPFQLIQYPKAVIWGAHCFSRKLPLGRWLVWLKKRDSQLGKFLSDAELAWMKTGTPVSGPPGVYLFKHVWHGHDRESERGVTLHPTQKPVALMRWCIERLKLKPGSVVLDPYMGSGGTGIAALQKGCRFIGVEIEESYYELSKRRIRKWMRRQTLDNE